VATPLFLKKIFIFVRRIRRDPGCDNGKLKINQE